LCADLLEYLGHFQGAAGLTIRVFVISDHPLIGWAIGQLLESAANRFSAAGSSPTCDQSGMQAVAAAAPDIVIFDIDGDSAQVMPCITRLVAVVPNAKILLFTRLNDTTLQDRAVIGGARGVIDRGTTPEQILTALTKVHAGEVWLERLATGRVFVELSRIGSHKPAVHDGAHKVASLTGREQQIVAFITINSGEPGKTVAARLCISESTLRNHLTSIYDKLGVANRNGLLAYAFQNGLATRLAKGTAAFAGMAVP